MNWISPIDMRVIHLACLEPPEIGGIGQAAYREVEGLRAQQVEAELWSPVSRPYLFRFGNASWLKLDWAALRRADVIHLHYPFYGTAERILWHASSLPPIVVTFHMDATASGWKGWIFSLHRRFVQPWLLRRASKIIVSSRDYAEHSSLRTFVKKYPDKIVELPFGVDIEFFKPAHVGSQPHPGPLLRKERESSILFVGGLDEAHRFKGLSVLFEALKQMNTSITLNIVGDGGLRIEYEKQVRDLNLSDRVHFLGKLSAEDLRNAFQQATVFAFPSTSAAEAFGIVAVEAQACGVPVVASSWPGVRTVVRDGETGFLVPPGDATVLAKKLTEIIQDQSLHERFSARARQWVEERFSEQAHRQGLMDVYTSL